MSVNTSTGTVTVKASGAGPVPTMMSSLESLAQSGGLEGGLVSSSQFFQTDYTKPLLFIADGGLLDDERVRGGGLIDGRDRRRGRRLALGHRLPVSNSQVSLIPSWARPRA